LTFQDFWPNSQTGTEVCKSRVHSPFLETPFARISRRSAAALKGNAVLASILMVLSAGIILALGVLHLIYTFSGTKLTPRDPALQVWMAEVSPVITRQTTMWKAWIGFNATHSSGAVLFGLVYGYFSVVHREVLFNSLFLLAAGLQCSEDGFLSARLIFQDSLQGRTCRNNLLPP
jgi:hypothetical protein